MHVHSDAAKFTELLGPLHDSTPTRFCCLTSQKTSLRSLHQNESTISPPTQPGNSPALSRDVAFEGVNRARQRSVSCNRLIDTSSELCESFAARNSSAAEHLDLCHCDTVERGFTQRTQKRTRKARQYNCDNQRHETLPGLTRTWMTPSGIQNPVSVSMISTMISSTIMSSSSSARHAAAWSARTW